MYDSLNSHLNLISALKYCTILSMQKIALRITIIILCCITCILPTYGKIYENCMIRHYSLEDGLPQSSVNAVMIGPRGYLWIATHAGLARFDGRRFIVYTSKNSVLNNDRILDLAIGQGSKIMLANAAAKERLYYIDEQFQLRQVQENRSFLFSDTYAPVFYDTLKRGTGGLYGRIMNNTDDILPNSCFAVNEYQFYLILRDTLYRMDTRAGTAQVLSTQSKQYCALINGKLLSINNKGILRQWNGGEQVATPKVTPEFKALLARIGMNASKPLSLFRNTHGDLALLRLDNEIWLIDEQQGLWQATLIFSDLASSMEVSAMCYERKNNLLFIGTVTDGLYIIRRLAFKTLFFDQEKNDKNNIYNQVQLNADNILNWYFIYNPFTGIKKRIDPPLYQSGLYRSAKGQVFYSRKGYLMITDTLFQKVKQIPLNNDKDVIKIICEDLEGRIWCATERNLFYLEDDRLIPLIKDYKDNLNTFLFPDKDHIWIGTADGMLIYNRKEMRIMEKRLGGSSVVSFFISKANRIFLCTYGDGIFTFADNKAVALPEDPVKSILFAHTIIEDKNGFFWITTNNGLLQCKSSAIDHFLKTGDRKSVYYYHYRDVNRFSSEFNGAGNAAYLRFNDQILLPTIKGSVLFDPHNTAPLLPNDEIRIENIKIDGERIIDTGHIEIPANNEHLEIVVAAAYFGYPENRQLEYTLSEASGKWFPVLDDPIVFNNLSKGVYKITIRKRIGFGPNDYSYRTVSFTVLPYWYETILARLALILIFVALTAFVINRRIRYLKKANIVLERKVAARTFEMEQQLIELNHSEQELYKLNLVQEQAISVILHDIRSPLNYLLLQARNFKESVHNLSSEELKEFADSLLLSSTNIINFSNDLLAWLNLNTNPYQLQNKPVEIELLFNRVKEIYDAIAANKGNTIEIGQIECSIFQADFEKLFLVLRNLVDNAIKHCYDGKITLAVFADQQTDKIILNISDTGKGMTANELEQLPQQHEMVENFRKDKLGLSMVNYFVNLMQGAVDVESAVNVGTTIRIILPWIK